MLRSSLFAVLALLSSSAFAQGPDTPSRVYLNGAPTPVYFNDGDAFRVLAGPNKGMRARLGGFNTLETPGPVHRWGTWHAKELYFISKMATMSAARGVWRCDSQGDTDTYGRVLWICKDLALDHIRRGLAHAMSIDYTPSPPEYLAAQRDAIENRRGMWAHGVPNYVLTSLHSADEGGSSRTYNRLVSTRDGHSVKWQHNDKYSECEWVCRRENKVPFEDVKEAVEELIVDPEIGADALKLGEEKLLQVTGDYAWLDDLGGVEDQKLAAGIKKKLDALRAAGKLGDGTSVNGSCGLYVVFERRYGQTRAECLK